MRLTEGAVMADRLERYARISAALAASSPEAAVAPSSGSEYQPSAGSVIHVAGEPVFVKRIALTDLELANRFSTENLFGLPPFLQYGVGSPGFGAWRELAANVMTTGWVLAGESPNFPLMYHWRVEPGAPPVLPEYRSLDEAVAYWGGADAVRDRFSAMAAASASLVLFLEYIPQALVDWLPTVSDLPGAYAMVEQGLRAGVDFMNARGLHHFDTHYGNILTDGRQIYIADLGLATTSEFALSEGESAFLDDHVFHDLGYVAMALVDWLATEVCGYAVPSYAGSPARNEFVRRCADGAVPSELPSPLAAILVKYAPLAAVMNDLYWELFGIRRDAPYPTDRVAPLAARLGR